MRQGTIHQGMVRSYGQGFQCTIIAVIALLMVYSRVSVRPSNWNAETIDRIILHGSVEYDNLILSSDRNYPRYLAHHEVPQFFDFMGSLFQVDIHDGLFYGVIGQDGSDAAMSISLQVAFNTGFSVSPMLLFTSGGMTVSIFHDDGEYFVFDSHARDQNGHPSSTGSAVLMSFSSIIDLVEYFDRFYEGQEFNISPVNLMCLDENSFADCHQLHSDLNTTATVAHSSYAHVSERINEKVKNDSHSQLCLNTCDGSNTTMHNTSTQTSSDDDFKIIDLKESGTRNSNCCIDFEINIQAVMNNDQEGLGNDGITHSILSESGNQTLNVTVTDHDSTDKTSLGSTNWAVDHACFERESSNSGENDMSDNVTCSLSSYVLQDHQYFRKEKQHIEMQRTEKHVYCDDDLRPNACTLTESDERQYYSCNDSELISQSCPISDQESSINDEICGIHMIQVPESVIQTFLANFNEQSCNLKEKITQTENKSRGECISTMANCMTDHTYFKMKKSDANLNFIPSDEMEGVENLSDLTSDFVLQDHQYFQKESKRKKKQKKNEDSYLNVDFIAEIKLLPEFTCCSCDKFLLKNQAFRCQNDFQMIQLSIGDTLCCNCYRVLKKFDFPHRNLRFNGLYAGEIPRQLQGLTLVEKRLISQINTFFTLIILPCFPVGQYAQKGFAIHFGNDISSIVSQLPRQVSNTGFVCFYSSNGQRKRLPFRSKVVKEALDWLVDNNRFYRDIDIINLDPENVRNVDKEIDLQESGIITTNYSQPSPDINVACNHTPINFLQSTNCEKLAFPWLFPYGNGTFLDLHAKKITLSQYFKTRLYAADGRWRKDIPYLMQAVNVLEKILCRS